MTKQGAAGPSALPVERAFVVQFRPEADIAQGPFTGRVEHVASGQAARFDSLEELLGFLGRVLPEGASGPSTQTRASRSLGPDRGGT